MFEIAKLPTFYFVDETKDLQLDLAASGDLIQGLADLLDERFQGVQHVGIILRTGPQLVLSFLAVLLSGRTPCILHYPTEKLSKTSPGRAGGFCL